jgi:hypothetical protein
MREIPDHVRRRRLGHAMVAGVSDRGAMERERSQLGVADTDPETVGRARPLEFDANGFPVAQRNPSFVSRVARLLNSQ